MKRTWLFATMFAGACVVGGYLIQAERTAGSGGSSTSGRKAMASWFITYKRPMAPPGVLSQVITSDHACLLKVTGPIVGVELPVRDEIGRYAVKCSDEQLRTLKTLASAALEEAAAARGATAARGARFLVFGVGEVGKAVDSLGSVPMTSPFSPAIQRFDDAMLALARTMIEQPQITLKGTGSVQLPEGTPQPELEVSITLRNSGTAPIRIHNPAAASADNEVGVEISLAKDVAADALEDTDRAQISLKRGEVTQPRPPGSKKDVAPQSFVKLAAGEELVLSARARREIRLSPGKYLATVTYTSLTEGVREQESVEGLLRFPAGPFTVKPRR